MNELDRIIQSRGWKQAVNHGAWALCTKRRNGWHVRRVVWGTVMARAEKRDGETIRRACIVVKDKR